ncbi:transcriptional regulator [Clostridium acetobutylicum]|nr:transcriptional regulator [Clostridium acetobutylicum]
MLMKILKRLKDGGIYSNKLMAKELGVSESIIEQMILQLEQLGYIKKDIMTSGCDCSSCAPKKKSCCTGGNVKIDLWKLTEKGNRAV